MKRHNNICILKIFIFTYPKQICFYFQKFSGGSDLIKICNFSWDTKISGFHQNIISQKKDGLTTRLQWEFIATKNLIILASIHPFVNFRWIHKSQDQPVKCAGRIPMMPGRFGKRTTETKHFEANVLAALEKDEIFPESDPMLLQIHTDLQQPVATPWPAIWIYGASGWCYQPEKGQRPDSSFQSC